MKNKHIKSFRDFKNFEHTQENEIIEEGFKEWLLGGLMALSTITGFYKLNKSVENDNQAKIEYSTQLDKAINNMNEDDVYNLVDDYNSTDRPLGGNSDIDTGIFTDDNGEVIDFEDTYGKDSIAGGKTYIIDIFKKNLKKEAEKNPDRFLISKDGKSIKLNPEWQGSKTVSGEHNLKDIYKSK